MKLLVLSAKNIEDCVQPLELQRHMRKALQEFSERTAFNFSRHVYELNSNMKLGVMPATSARQKIAGYKAVTVVQSPNNLNPHQGLISLLDEPTGRVKCILDGGRVTALRTAAVSAAATDQLSRKDSAVLTVIGAGTQAYEHVLALVQIRKFTQIKIFSRSEKSAQLLLNRLLPFVNCDLTVVTSVRAALQDAGVIVTCTNSREPLFSTQEVAPGTHINAIGACRPGFHEVELTARPGLKIFLDSEKSCHEEAAEITGALSRNKISGNDIRGEIGACFSGAISGRTENSDITFFKSVGLGVTDLFAADYFYHRCLQLGLGSAVDFSEGD